MKTVDTNFIVRFLLNDSPKQAKAVEKILKSSFEDIILTDLVVTEGIYVLRSIYGLSKEDVIEKIYKLLQIPAIICDRQLIYDSLITYLNHNKVLSQEMVSTPRA